MVLMKRFTLALIVALPLAACTVEQTKEAELPDVDVDVEGGQMPEFDVDAAEIEVGMETKTVEVPDVDVDVNTKEVEVAVPDVDINMPDDEDDDHDS